MKVGVLQSSYMPWKGYFDLIHSVDLFIFYDDVQFTKNDWRNRNKIKGSNGPIWLSVPVGQDISRKICEVEIKERKWQEVHWKTLKQYYGKAPHWGMYESWLKHIYLEIQWSNLSNLNQYIMRHIAEEFLNIETGWDDSRDYILEGHKEERLLDLLKKIESTEYISTPKAKDYIKEEKFEEVGIKLNYIDTEHYPEYPQLYPPFTHGVSILDLLLNTGPKAPYYIWGWRK